MKLSIIIPVYNEEKTLETLLSQVENAQIDCEKEIILVDDFSKDGTRDILKKYQDKHVVYYRSSNGGKGSAVRDGLKIATGDYCIIQDADLEYDPSEINSLLKLVDEDHRTVVFGSRNLHHEKREGFILSRLGVWVITKMTNVLYGLGLTDIWTCYKLFPSHKKDLFVGGQFDSEILFTLDLAHRGMVFKEAPISHNPRSIEEGKKIRYRDGFKAIFVILSHKLLHLKKEEKRKPHDTSGIYACPTCKGDLSLSQNELLCSVCGSYKIDKEGRPLLIENDTLNLYTEKHESGINWLKSFLKQFPKIYYSIWHLFCPVMMLVNGPRKILKDLEKGSLVVDVGSGPERLHSKFINLDIYHFPEVDIVGDATAIPIRDGSIDAAVSESLIEHVPDAQKVIDEMIRIVKPGGLIYVSAPFMHPYHASPDDFNRWTISGLKYLCRGAEVIEVGVRSGPWSTLLMFMAYWLGVIFSFGSRKLAPFLAHIFMLILGPLKYLDYFFMKIPGSDAVATHLYIIARKNN